MVKVVHISTYSSGGAGRAAYRLHEGLLMEPEIQSTFISAANDYTEYDNNHIAVHHKATSFYDKVCLKLRLQKPNCNYLEELKKIKSNHDYFSSPETNYLLEKEKVIKNADIINLHWVADFLNFPTFFKAFKHKPVIWTIHDMNPFMGGFHYKNDSEKNRKFTILNNAFLKLKKKNIQLSNDLTIVSPSSWLLNEAIDSGVFKKETKYHIIPNGLDVNKFQPKNKISSRRILGLDENLPCIMFIADDLSNFRKGFDLFNQAIRSMSNKNFQVLTIGNNKIDLGANFKVIHLGVINNDELLSNAYSAADILVLPSREDNLPNVMPESFACGTPVLSFKVGGMSDWIIPKFNGVLAPEVTSQSLQIELEEFILNSKCFDKNKIRNFAVKNFSLKNQARNYSQLYQSIINERFPFKKFNEG